MATTTRGPGTTIAAGLLPEFEREMAATRACLERVPMADSGWKPHPRSMSLGQVSTFLAVLPSWTTTTIGQASLDLAGPPQAPTPPTSRDALLELFDRNVADARAALAGASDHHLTEAWTLCQDGKTLLELPRIVVLRSFVMNHLVHHRGQLTVYLRMLDVPVPALYGPSADEGGWSPEAK